MNTTIYDNPEYLASQILGYISISIMIPINIPQVVQIFKTKSAKDVSLLSIILNILCGITHTSYGILIQELPIIIGECIYTLISIILLIGKFKYDKETCKKKIEICENDTEMEKIKDNNNDMSENENNI